MGDEGLTSSLIEGVLRIVHTDGRRRFFIPDYGDRLPPHDVTTAELAEARNIAREMIEKFLLYLDRQRIEILSRGQPVNFNNWYPFTKLTVGTSRSIMASDDRTRSEPA